ncbi:hypothetical protein [Nocardioides sp.]|uniref:hypothetical protein n=1 Tax=Nocardioides sp. TaxID=35761 RepID=UPI002B8D8FE7|nr:hypothetical protein [Nocardioides sp.]HXH79504.1 hypothetical protein [Nocardioides sp.]
MIERPLGRREPSNWVHTARYPLTAATVPTTPVPVVLGALWYSAFDRPTVGSDGRWWIGRGDLGRVRGGHAVCLKPQSLRDSNAWWVYHNQQREGACVGWAASRAMTLLNRKRLDARWLWNRAKEIDEWSDTNPGDDNGTSVRAAMDVLRRVGHVPIYRGVARPVDPAEGIVENRWAQSADEVLACLQSPAYATLGAVPLLNSWGRDYPHLVYLPLEVLDRLIREDGEATMFVDRVVS